MNFQREIEYKLERDRMIRKMEDRIEYLTSRFQRVRTSSLSISLVENLTIREHTPLQYLASISRLNGTQLKVNVYNPADYKLIKQRISLGDLDCNITEFNKKELTLTFATLTKEDRTREALKAKQSLKIVKDELRVIAQENKKRLKKSLERSEITKDEHFELKSEVQEIYESFLSRAAGLYASVVERISKI